MLSQERVVEILDRNNIQYTYKQMGDLYGESNLPLMEAQQNLSLYSLQSNLLKIWTEKKVDKYYQNTMLAYMDDLPEDEAKSEIMKELERMLENKSQYNKIKQYINHREEVLDILQEMLEDQAEIEDACESLDELRKINLKLCQCIFDMKESLESRGLNANAICQGYNQLFKKLNSDNAEITNSYLKKYIGFGKGYDPFFLTPYERIQKRVVDEQIPKCVSKLFKMNISYVYRLIKAKNEIVKCLSCPCLDMDPNLSKQAKPKPKIKKFKESANEEDSEAEEVEKNKPKKSSQKISQKAKDQKMRASISEPQVKQAPVLIKARELEARAKNSSAGKNAGIKLPKIESASASKDKLRKNSTGNGSRMTIKKKNGFQQFNAPLVLKSPPSNFKAEDQSEDEIDAYRKKIIARKLKVKPENNTPKPESSLKKSVKPEAQAQKRPTKKKGALNSLSPKESIEKPMNEKKPLSYRSRSHRNIEAAEPKDQSLPKKIISQKKGERDQVSDQSEVESKVIGKYLNEQESDGEDIQDEQRVEEQVKFTGRIKRNERSSQMRRKPKEKPKEIWRYDEDESNANQSRYPNHSAFVPHYNPQSFNPHHYPNYAAPHNPYTCDDCIRAGQSAHRPPQSYPQYPNGYPNQYGSVHSLPPPQHPGPHFSQTGYNPHYNPQSPNNANGNANSSRDPYPYPNNETRPTQRYEGGHRNNQNFNTIQPEDRGKNYQGNRNSQGNPNDIERINQSQPRREDYSNRPSDQRNQRPQGSQRPYQDDQRRLPQENNRNNQESIRADQPRKLPENSNNNRSIQPSREPNQPRKSSIQPQKEFKNQQRQPQKELQPPKLEKASQQSSPRKESQSPARTSELPSKTQPIQQNAQQKSISPQKKESSQNMEASSLQSQKRQIQMKPGQIKLPDLFKFIQEQKVNQKNRSEFEIGPWKENIRNKHSYLTKFFLNSELAAFGISTPRNDGDYHILYWGVVSTDTVTEFLFKKYTEYLEKFTALENIYINSGGYQNMNFAKKGESFVKKRSVQEKKELQFTPFLSIQCSNICFNQSTDISHSTFFSEEIEDFKQKTSKTCATIGLANSGNLKALPSFAKGNEKVPNIIEVNKLLEKYEADTYATSEEINTGECRLIVMKQSLTIKRNQFYVRDGYFMMKGMKIHDNAANKAVVFAIEMEREGIYMFFGKKFSDIEDFLKLCNSRAPGTEANFAFKMFTKQLYGRMKNKQFQADGCYGNWDIDFIWQDQLKGVVIKDMPQPNCLFGPENFFIAIFKAETLLYGFQVNSNDFLF